NHSDSNGRQDPDRTGASGAGHRSTAGGLLRHDQRRDAGSSRMADLRVSGRAAAAGGDHRQSQGGGLAPPAPQARSVRQPRLPNPEPMHIDDLLRTAAQAGASDVHLKVGSYPMMRVNGTLAMCSEEKRLERADTESMADSIFTADQREKFR